MEIVVDHSILLDLDIEIDRQEGIHRDGYGSNRNGIRLGIACAEDEIREALEAWDKEKRREYRDGWKNTREELLQAAGVIMRTIESIDRDYSEWA